VEELKPTIVNNLTESMVKNLKKEGRFAKVYANRSAGGNAIIVKGKIVRFNGGNGAAKFFLGFMAPKSGKTNIAISGQLIDAKARRCWHPSMTSGQAVKAAASAESGGVMPIQATDEGEVIAEFISKLAKK